MWPLLISILILVGLLVFVLVFRRKKDPRPSAPVKEPSAWLKAPPGTEFQKKAASPVFHPVPDSPGAPVPDPTVPDWSQELKGRLEQGVEVIFSAVSGADRRREKVLRFEDLDPQILQALRQQIRDLKNFRATYELCRALDNPESSMSELAKIIVTDPILSGKILKVANSAYFGLPQKVNSIGQALMIIGLFHIKNMMYREGLKKLVPAGGDSRDHEMEWLWEHAVLTSICAGYIQEVFPGLDKGTVFTLGLLHDVGKFILRNLPPREPRATAGMESPRLSEGSLQWEEKRYGINHALIGRLAFEEWEFSELMKTVVELHHAPQVKEIEELRLDGERTKYLLVLFLADQVAKVLAGEEGGMVSIAPLAEIVPPPHPSAKAVKADPR